MVNQSRQAPEAKSNAQTNQRRHNQLRESYPGRQGKKQKQGGNNGQDQKRLKHDALYGFRANSPNCGLSGTDDRWVNPGKYPFWSDLL